MQSETKTYTFIQQKEAAKFIAKKLRKYAIQAGVVSEKRAVDFYNPFESLTACFKILSEPKKNKSITYQRAELYLFYKPELAKRINEILLKENIPFRWVGLDSNPFVFQTADFVQVKEVLEAELKSNYKNQN